MAHRARKSWKTFEESEREIDSSTVTEPDPSKKAILSRDALDNGLRLAILEQIAPRICVEIFGETWTVVPDSPAADSVVEPEEPHTKTAATPPLSADQEEDYTSDPDRTVKRWRSGGPFGAIPVFEGEPSDDESEVDLNEYDDWLRQEE